MTATKEQRDAAEARITELEAALQMARDYLVEDRGGEPRAATKPEWVDYATVVIDRIDKAMAK